MKDKLIEKLINYVNFIDVIADPDDPGMATEREQVVELIKELEDR